MKKSVSEAILDGELASQALEAVESIRDALSEKEILWSAEIGSESGKQIEPPALGSGLSGFAVFHANMAKLHPGEGHEESAAKFLAMAHEQFELHSYELVSPSLYGGYTGLGWAREFVKRILGVSTQDDANEEIDELLLEQIQQLQTPANYDLVSGCVGWGIYSLERADRSTAQECIEGIVNWLDQTAEKSAEGITWHTAPVLLPEHQRKEAPNGYYNLGLAHGIPGILTFLAGAYQAKISQAKVSELLEGAVSWMLKKQLPEGLSAQFGFWFYPGVEQKSSRHAWCYGDPGIATPLLCAARALGREDWEKKALEIGVSSAQRSFEEAGVVDPGICHGAAGLAHIFNRLYLETKHPVFAEAVRNWVKQTLQMRRPGTGVAGFSARRMGDNHEPYWEPEKGLLEGAAGIGLALLGASLQSDLSWDRFLAISIKR